jgi:hypothetical protein
MTDLTLCASRLTAGVWHVLLTGPASPAPVLRASHDGQDLPDLHCAKGDAERTWRVSVPVPVAALSDGLQTVVIHDAQNIVVAQLAILSGAPLAADLRAEIALLRAEFDLLKAAIRRDHHLVTHKTVGPPAA